MSLRQQDFKRIRATPETVQFLELFAQSGDIVVFAEQILGIALNRAQKRWFRVLAKMGEHGPEWLNKYIVLVAGNQVGKSIGIAIIILWACWNKVGVPRLPDDQDRWADSAYQWFHLAPTQQQAYLVLKDIQRIVAGTHEAQDVGRKRGLRFRFPRQFVQFSKVEDYDGMQLVNGAVVQFRTTDDKAKALQGRRAAGISYDEAAFEDHLKSVINETLMMRLVSTGGPLLLVSTPNGINDYYEVVREIQTNGEETADMTWEWRSVKRALVWSTVADNVGFGLSAEIVAERESTLDAATKEQQLRGAFLEPAEAFFVPTTNFIEAFVAHLPDVQEPLKDHQYVIFWDTSAQTDPVAVIILDVTTRPFTGVYFRHYRTPPRVDQLLLDIRALHGLYNAGGSKALTGWDATGMGGVQLKQLLSGISPSRPLNFGGPKAKIDMLTNLRAAMSTKQLLLPKTWHRVEREIVNYRLDDKKIQQDCVMSLAGAAQLAVRGFSGVQSRPFQPVGRIAVRPAW